GLSSYKRSGKGGKPQPVSRVKSDHGVIHFRYVNERAKRLAVALGGGEQELGNALLNHRRRCLPATPNKAPSRAAPPSRDFFHGVDKNVGRNAQGPQQPPQAHHFPRAVLD